MSVAQRDIDQGDLVAEREAERTFSGAWEDLDGYLIGEDLPEHLEDHATAERMLRSVARRRRELERSQEIAKAEHARIDAWLNSERIRLATDYFERCLTDYHAALLAQDPKVKTVRLPSGSLTSRTGQPQWEVDEEAFLPWAETYAASLLRTKVEPALAEMKKVLAVDAERGVAVDQAGELVPGVRVLPAEVQFKVKTGDES